MNRAIPTKRGVCSLIARKLELVGVSWALSWAEGDIHYYTHVDPYPEKVEILKRDAAALRVRQALLR